VSEVNTLLHGYGHHEICLAFKVLSWVGECGPVTVHLAFIFNV